MIRTSLIGRLAWQDYRDEWRLSACAVLALVAVLAPLLVMFGLKAGLVGNLTTRLERSPQVREIVPLAGARLSGEQLDRLAMRTDVAFAVPRTRQIAATLDVRKADSQGLLSTAEMIPTAPGDPLLGQAAAPAGLGTVVLSHTLASKLDAQVGDHLEASIGRQVAGQPQARQLSLQVSAVLPIEAFARDGVFASLSLLEAAEDYRDGRAVPSLGWPGTEPTNPAMRVYPAFRLYARGLDDVEPLRQWFAGQGITVATQAEAIAQVRSLSHNLSVVFWIIASLALGGAFAAIAAGTLAAVERKRKPLAVLRLMGFPVAALLLFVQFQALYSAALASVISGALYLLASRWLNELFAGEGGETACYLADGHYLLACLATLFLSGLAATAGGWRTTRIEPAEGIRDV